MLTNSAQLDALAVCRAVTERLVDFSLDANYLREPRLPEICRRLWSGPGKEGGLIADLWIEGAFPADAAEAKPNTLRTLSDAGLFEPMLAAQLDRRSVNPFDRRLYSHQKAALLAARAGRDGGGPRPAIVVTAGTGAGKTESFLLPLLDDLWTRRQNGTSEASSGGGVQCVILYPMNALVNDQVDRLYDWLQKQEPPKGCRPITLFHFTSETPEDSRQADRENIRPWDPCRYRTRKQARGWETASGQATDVQGAPPDILITNYSMLEYMLCRPQDAPLLGSALRAIVLDEAHLYTGTLAAEITLLMRRLLERCGKTTDQVLQIATSATLGTGDENELRNFAATLFSKSPESVCVIKGEKQRVALPKAIPPAAPVVYEEVAFTAYLTGPTLALSTQPGKRGEPELAHDTEQVTHLSSAVRNLVGNAAIEAASKTAPDHPATFLHAALAHAPLVHRLEALLWKHQRSGLSLSNLARELWELVDDVPDGAIKATLALLNLGAVARSSVNTYPLVPHRAHLIARAPDGISLCLNGDCTGPAELRFAPYGSLSALSGEHCPHCRGAMLPLYRCENCGEWVLCAVQEGNKMRPPLPGERKTSDPRYLSTSPNAPRNNTRLYIGATDGVLDGFGSDAPGFAIVDRCPHCTEETGEEEEAPETATASRPSRPRSVPFVPVFTAPTLALSILAETTLSALPPYPSATNAWLPARGRRLLAFSDSRTQAARLGPTLTYQHERQLVRATILRTVRGTSFAEPELVAALQSDLDNYTEQAAKAASEAVRRRAERQRDDVQSELDQLLSGGSVPDWADKVKDEARLAEVVDAESAEKHDPNEWATKTQREWDKNARKVQSEARQLLGLELVSPTRRQTTLETLGLVEIVYPGFDDALTNAHEPLDKLLGEMPTVHVRECLQEAWRDFLASLCDTLRFDNVITLGAEEEDRAYSATYSVPIGKWCSESDIGYGLIRFVGATEKQRRRRFAAAVLKACGMPDDDVIAWSEKILSAAFQCLLRMARSQTLPWLEHAARQSGDASVDAIRLSFPGLALRRPQRLWRSARTGHLFPRAVVTCGPETGCDDLSEADETTLDTDPRHGRLRREYATADVFSVGLWGEEHSAQLSPQENRRLQDLFKLGARNVLSSTTTLELGIDIGGLSAVLMSNVPPGKANYLQRAGRAGRRADGSSLVITFARSRPFDREVFHRFGDYLKRDLRRPVVHLDRERIARRHAHSLLLGDLFRAVYPADAFVGAMRAFGTMGGFCGAGVPAYWDDTNSAPAVPESVGLRLDTTPTVPWWKADRRADAPLAVRFEDFLTWARDTTTGVAHDELLHRLRSLLKATPVAECLDDPRGFFGAVLADFIAATGEWRGDYDALLAGWQEAVQGAVNAQAKRKANALRYQIRLIADLTVIESLSDKQFLPRYGFPVGLQKLKVLVPRDDKPGKTREEDQMRLSRGGLQAIGEYVPGSRLLVGGKQVVSRGLLKRDIGTGIGNEAFGQEGQYATCTGGHFYCSIPGSGNNCPYCLSPANGKPRSLLVPRYGYTNAASEPITRRTQVERVGYTAQATIALTAAQLTEQFAGIRDLDARYQENGEMLSYNEGEHNCGFAICLKCGYADSERTIGKDGAVGLPAGFDKHPPVDSTNRNSRCWKDGKAHVWRNRTLAARQTTDILLLDFSRCLTDGAKDRGIMYALALALTIAGARLLDLDSRDLGTLLAPAGIHHDSQGAVIYDNVPGGAGHVQELLKIGRPWLHAALETLYVSDEHHMRCETACLDCLLTYGASDVVIGDADTENGLKRRRAYELLKVLLDGVTVANATSLTAPPSAPGGTRDADERRRRAAQRAVR